MPSQLLFSNVPHDCSELELKAWIESRGIGVESVRIIRDLLSGTSPAFAYADLQDHVRLEDAVFELNGRRMRNQNVLAKLIPQRRSMIDQRVRVTN